MARLVLVPSPFVGANAWSAVADTAPDARIADYGEVHGPDWYERVAQVACGCGEGAPWIAVLHSGAGGFAPAIAEAARDLLGVIYVDAVWPYPGRSCLETAPDALVDQLRRLTRDGRLAPWNQWFDTDPTLRWIPDADLRAAFLRDLPRTPFAFLEAVCPKGAGWETTPSAYLQLSKGFELTADRAAALGWPVVRLPANHLAALSDPEKVGRELAALAGRLTGA